MPAVTPVKPTCQKCGAPLQGEGLQGYCPACAGHFAFGPSADDEAGGSSQSQTVVILEGTTLRAGSSAAECASSTLARFGDYELLEEIARGGMGVVYKARQKSLERIVAIKMILAGQFAGKQLTQRFRGEAAAAGTLQHPNIVAIHEIGMHEGQHFFSMDFVEGQNLAQLAGNRPLPPTKAARYVKLISEAIHHAHQQGILHRDLKPSNVLIDAATDQPRVTDFGLAKRLDGESSLTVTGQVLGSPNFMPPEQASGSRGKVGRHSDVYGLGGILFYLLTARAPFQGETLETTIHEVLNTEPLSPRLLNPSVPVDLETICLKCLEKEPEKRYATAQNVADELGRFLNDEPIQARPVTRIERAWRWCRRKPALAGSLATAVLLLLIVAVGSPIAALRINRARLDTQREAQRAEAGETAFRLSAYAADMNVAHAALQEHNLARAMQSLERWIPTNAASSSAQSHAAPDLRGWEWRYLRSQCRSDERATLTTSQTRHTGAVVSVAYSPDGKWLSSGSHDGRVKVFDLSTHKEIAEFAHEKAVRSVAFSPRDSRLATLCGDGFLRFWDVQTHASLGAVPASGGEYVGALAYSRDGSWLAFSEARQGWITVSNLTTQTSFATNAHVENLTGLAFSPDATVLATRGWDGVIKLWDTQTWRLKHVLSHTKWGMSTISFSPDGRQLVSTSIDQTWKLWDTGSGQLLHTEKSRSSPCAAVFLSDGKTVAVANDDYTIALSQPTTAGWKEVVLKGHRLTVWALALSPDGNELASGSADGEVKLWSTRPPPEPSDWLPLPGSNFQCLSSDGSAFLLALDGTIELWNSATLTRTATLTWPETNVNALALHSDAKTIVSASNDGTIKLWRLTGRSLQEERSFKLNPNNGSQLALSPDGKTVAVAMRNTIFLCDLESTQRLHELGQDGVYKVRFSSDGARLASTGWDGKVKLWQVANGRCLWTSAHTRTSVDAAFFPDGKRLVTGAWEPKAILWDVASGRELAAFRGQLLGADSVAVSPDGQRVAMGAGEGAVSCSCSMEGSSRSMFSRFLASRTGRGGWFSCPAAKRWWPYVARAFKSGTRRRSQRSPRKRK